MCNGFTNSGANAADDSVQRTDAAISTRTTEMGGILKVKAMDQFGNRVMVPFQPELNELENHEAALRQFAVAFGVSGRFIAGSTGRGWVVWVPRDGRPYEVQVGR